MSRYCNTLRVSEFPRRIFSDGRALPYVAYLIGHLCDLLANVVNVDQTVGTRVFCAGRAIKVFLTIGGIVVGVNTG